MLIVSREDKWDYLAAHSPHLYLLLVTIFTSLMEGGCHCCDWMRIWLLIMIYEVLKWLFKWVEEVLVPSWIHKHKCILLSQECFSACDISLLLDSKDVLQRRRKYGGSLLPQQQCHVYVFVAVWLLAMSSYWWCDSKLCLQTCVWLSASFKYVSMVDECALIAKVSFHIADGDVKAFCANSEHKTGSAAFYLPFPVLYLSVWKAALFSGKTDSLKHFNLKESKAF